jgi:hypothetical protein
MTAEQPSTLLSLLPGEKAEIIHHPKQQVYPNSFVPTDTRSSDKLKKIQQGLTGLFS